jgi:uncharacterized membrane protein SpoIIM required for sporulation
MAVSSKKKTLTQIKLSDKPESVQPSVVKKEKKKFFNWNVFKDKKQYFLNNLKKMFIASSGLLIAIVISYFIFPENIGLFTIILTTLFLMPYIYKESKYNQLIFGRKKEIEKDGVSITQMSPSYKGGLRLNQVYSNNQKLIDLYLLFFIGILFTILLLILVLPSNLSSTIFSSVGWDDNLIPSKQIGFENQDKLTLFKEIGINNLSVIFVCFLFALIFPSAGILIVVWNAVFWGVVFTQYTLVYSFIYDMPYTIVFLGIFWSSIPHIFLEAISYFFSAIAGILLAISIKTDLGDLDRFSLVLKYCIILLAFAIVFVLAGSFFEIYVFDMLKNLFFKL